MSIRRLQGLTKKICEFNHDVVNLMDNRLYQAEKEGL
jgi:hypothetical protein